MFPAMPDNSDGNTPQFQTAAYAQPASDVCKGCNQPITGLYYRANGATVCGSCADRIKRQAPADSHSDFTRAILFGLVGFAIGLTLYAAFVIITGISIGYISLAVGWIVGKAMMLGSKGVGGRRYQVTAVLLTYAAVSMAFIPIAISSLRSEKSQPKVEQRSVPQSPTSASDGSTENAPTASAQENKPAVSFGKAIASLVMIGLASPFIELQEGFNGFIGLIILFVGMQFAWKMTAGARQINVEGPYQQSAATSA
jgi:hypothetical protein